MKILLGMSGGVDSSTAAVILKNQGHDVEGLSLRLFEARGRTCASSCCSMAAMEDARAAAGAAGIRHRILDARDLFTRTVVEPFALAYAGGLTPNPCVLCNQHVKFPLLMQEAGRSGFTHIATGHYARTGDEASQALLQRGLDPVKDQSYFLYSIGLRALGMSVFPLGCLMKDDVRAIAREAGLSVFNRPESQEICFVENDDYASAVRSLLPGPVVPGPVIGPGGMKLGEHNGTINFTIGQRRGLGISWHHPLYVTRIDARSNTVYVGPREEAMKREFHVGNISWMTSQVPAPLRAGVKIRSTMRDRPAMVEPIGNDRARVRYDEPEFAPAPGQSAVFYDGDSVIGGGTIEP